jgi:UDP-N-acetylglucosamine 4,6-dehydratase/5-epimerase
MEKLIIAANHYKGKRKTKFCCVRYGNVFGSSGSVIPKFVEQIQHENSITVTDLSMTRFNIEMNDALNLILDALKITRGGEVFIPKLKSYVLSDLVKAFQIISKVKFKIKKIPVRSGEKFHELFLGIAEIPYTTESKNIYILNSSRIEISGNPSKHHSKIKILDSKDLSSEYSQKLTSSELARLLKNHNYTP